MSKKKLTTEYISEEEYNQLLEKSFEDAKKYCEKYGLRCELIFDEIHIYTNFEEFYFIPEMGEKINLMHRDGILGSKFHQQFYKKISIYELVKYIDHHTKYKYNPQKLKREKIGRIHTNRKG